MINDHMYGIWRNESILVGKVKKLEIWLDYRKLIKDPRLIEKNKISRETSNNFEKGILGVLR